MKIKEEKQLNDLEYNFLNDYTQKSKKEITEQEKAEAMHTIGQFFKVLMFLFFAPICIIGFFCIECAKQGGSGRGSKRR